MKNKKLEKIFKNIKPIDITSKKGYEKFCKNYGDAMQEAFGLKRRKRPKCRFCGAETRPLNTNAIIGPGYREWNYVCKECGRVQ